jgi:hypothetical protein
MIGLEVSMRNLEDLMKRYGIAKSSLSEFIKNHITEINNDGQNHIVTDRKVKWFDDYAVQRIDELRGYNSNVTLAAEAAKADRERELLEENSQVNVPPPIEAEASCFSENSTTNSEEL